MLPNNLTISEPIEHGDERGAIVRHDFFNCVPFYHGSTHDILKNKRGMGASGLNTKGPVYVLRKRGRNGDGDGGRDPDGLWLSGKCGTWHRSIWALNCLFGPLSQGLTFFFRDHRLIVL